MRITFVLGRSGLKEPIFEQRVHVDGLELDLTLVPSATEGTSEMLAGHFDTGEMSLAYCLQAIDRGVPLVALPIFTARRFFQPCATYRGDSGISGPEDLAGRRVGVPLYWMTSSIWHRGLLQHRYGVAPQHIEWHQCGAEYFSLDGLPRTVNIVTHHDRTPLQLLQEGAVDALLEPRLRVPDAKILNLFGDPVEAACDEFVRTGVNPVVHVIAVKASMLKAQPGLAAALLTLFERSKADAYANPPKFEIEPLIPGISHEEARRRLGVDPYPFGIAANERAIETFLDYAAEQGLTSRRLALGEAFVM